MRNEVKASGLQDTPDNCWQFFIERVSVDPACHSHSTLSHTAPEFELAWVCTCLGEPWAAGWDAANACKQSETADVSSNLPQPCTCSQVRKNLHVVLCFSPVGDKFRIRARQFPALVNCTVVDWWVTGGRRVGWCA